MEEPNNLQEWGLLSDSNSNSQMAVEEIIHADYFSLDSTKLHSKDHSLFLSTNEQLGLQDIGFLSDENLTDGSEMEVGIEESEVKDQNCYVVDSELELRGGEINKGSSFLRDDSKMEVGIEGFELNNQYSFVIDSDAEKINKGGSFLVDGSPEVGNKIANGDSLHGDDSKIDLSFDETEIENRNCYAVDPKHEPGIQEIEKGDFLLVDNSKMELGIAGVTNEDSLIGVDSKIDLGSEGTEFVHENAYAVESKHKLCLHEIQDGKTLLIDDFKVDQGIGEIDTNSQNSQELVSDSSVEMSNSGSISVNDGEKKVSIWWKLPWDMIKLFACKVRPAWSISVAAAVIGILMVGRRLYQMKHKSRRIPLKASFEDKKVASQILLRAARLNEVIVRHVPVIRSPLLPAGGVTPWSVGGQL